VASPDRDRAVAFGLQLAQAHQRLRRQIEQLKMGLGRRRLDDDMLVTRCLTFCHALTAHHRGEDTGLFAQLLRERPDLAGTIAKLVEDHDAIASILSRRSRRLPLAHPTRTWRLLGVSSTDWLRSWSRTSVLRSVPSARRSTMEYPTLAGLTWC